MFKRKASNKSSSLLPLLDIIFLVLFIFFYLLMFMVQQHKIDIALPESIVSVNQNRTSLSISIDKNNQVYFQSEQISWEQLEDKISSLSNQSKLASPIILLSADKETKHDKFIQVISLLSRYNINEINIETIPAR